MEEQKPNHLNFRYIHYLRTSTSLNLFSTPLCKNQRSNCSSDQDLPKLIYRIQFKNAFFGYNTDTTSQDIPNVVQTFLLCAAVAIAVV